MLTIIEPYIAPIVQTLAHSLWQGALMVVLLWGILRKIPARSAEVRYSIALASLCLLVASLLVTFSIINPTSNGINTTATATSNETSNAADHSPFENQSTSRHTKQSSVPADGVPVNPGNQSPSRAAPPVRNAWQISFLPLIKILFWTWFAGAILQLIRALRGLHAGYALATQAQPLLPDLNSQASELLNTVTDLCQRLGLRISIRTRITEQIDIPAVWGWFSPVLLLPAAMLTGLSTEHWRVIIAHELAHIRRFDPLIDLAQRLIESLLFFNPAIWWLNRSIRREREACCDAVAAQLVGESISVASILVNLADRIQTARSSTATLSSFADPKQPGELTDRVERLVTPDARPRLLLPWASLIGLLVLFFCTLFLAERTSTYAVQIVKKIMTPAERAEKIAEINEKFPSYDFQEASRANEEQLSQKVEVEGTVRLADGKPIPPKSYGRYDHSVSHGGSRSSVSGNLGQVDQPTEVLSVKQTFPRFEEFFFSFEVPGYAPGLVGPLQPLADGQPLKFDLVLDHGFEGRVLLQGQSGENISRAKVRGDLFAESKSYSNNGSSSSKTTFKIWDLEPDASGLIRLPQALDREMEWTIVAPGYQENVFRRKLNADAPVEIALTPARPTSGRILDAMTGDPISNAEFILIHKSTNSGSHQFGFGDPRQENGVIEPYRVYTHSDSDGKFVLDMLRDRMSYTFYIRTADGRIAGLRDVEAGETEQREVLMPAPIQITGKVMGDISNLPTRYLEGKQQPYVSWSNPIGESLFSTHETPITPAEDGGSFVIRNLVPGKIELRISDRNLKFDLEKSITDLSIDLTSSEPAENLHPDIPLRKIQVHLAGLPANSKIEGFAHYHHPLLPTNQTVDLTSPDFTIEAPVGQYLTLSRVDLPGYWANGLNQIIQPGDEPFKLDWPVFPAGGLTGKFLTPLLANDPPPVLSIYNLVRPPSVTESIQLPEPTFGDHQEFACAPLPLGGTYRLIANDRRPGSAALSIYDFTVTSEQPFEQAEIRFPEGRTINVRLLDPDGTPVPNQTVTLEYSNEFEFFNFGETRRAGVTGGGKSFKLQTDTNGVASFHHLQDGLPSNWKVSVDPGDSFLGEIHLVSPNVSDYDLQLRPAIVFTGTLLDAETGKPLSEKSVYCASSGRSNGYPMVLPDTMNRTDAEGRFKLLLDNVTYQLTVFGCRIESLQSGTEEIPVSREQPNSDRIQLPYPIPTPLTIKVTPAR